jgi:hypothetical protein
MGRNKPHKALLQKYMRITDVTVWEQWQYCFDFGKGIYVMDGKNLRIRPAEELYLYERLVLYKRPKETTCRYAIQRLRERYGADFLAEVFEHSPSGGMEGKMRRGAFERILQEYLEKDGRMGYERWGYHFDFLNGSYTWSGKELRVTPREAVFLYERLILCLRGRHGLRRYTESNILCIIRKKFGRRFLHEIFPNEETANDIAAVLRQRAEKLKGSSVAVSTDG